MIGIKHDYSIRILEESFDKLRNDYDKYRNQYNNISLKVINSFIG